jgi:hypothetical protein
MGLHAVTTHARMFFPLFCCSLSPLPVFCGVQLVRDGSAVFSSETTGRIRITFLYETLPERSGINLTSVQPDPV